MNIMQAIADYFSISIQQLSFIIGMQLGAFIPLYIAVESRRFTKKLLRANAELSNDLDFTHAELMMVASRTNPILLSEMKKSDEYKRMVAQYQANKSFINLNGRRP